jgi:hypothetical protein
MRFVDSFTLKETAMRVRQIPVSATGPVSVVLAALIVTAVGVAAAVPALAQSPTAGAASGSGSSSVIPKNGQSPQQAWRDRYECSRWAVSQSGFDPSSTSGASAGSAGEDGYQRAFTACLEGRGYTVGPATAAPAVPAPPRYTPSPATTPSPGTTPSRAAVDPAFLVRDPEQQRPQPHASQANAQLKDQPFAVQIEGGYSIASGTTHDLLDGGSNVGLGFTWFPAPALPVGLRVDGSYSDFRLSNAALPPTDGGYTRGHEYVYGGDADLQFDLAHRSAGYKFYLFGGAGWYREQTQLRAIQYQSGVACGFYQCFEGYFPVEVGSTRTTSPWLHSWNAGIGFEAAIAERTSFFLEARFQRIGQHQSSQQDFVPIRLGLRF